MTKLAGIRTVCGAAVLAAGVLALTAGVSAAAEPKRKDNPWLDQDARPSADTSCDYLGKGYMKAPGSDTCIRVNGYVRSEVSVFGR